MQAVTVSAFHDQQINGAVFIGKLQGRIVDNGFVKTAEITRIADLIPASVFPDADHGDGRTQDMPRIIQGTGHVPADVHRLAIGIPVKVRQCLLGIINGIQGLHRLQAVLVKQIVNRFKVKVVTIFF